MGYQNLNPGRWLGNKWGSETCTPFKGLFWVPQGLGEGVSGTVAPPIPEEYFTNKITNLPSLFIEQFLPRENVIECYRKKERSLLAKNQKKKQLKK